MPSPEALRAADPATPADELRRLAERDDCKEAVAGNPNAPLDALRRLSQSFPDQVAANTALELALLADLSALQGFDLRALAGAPVCPPSLIFALIDAAYPPQTSAQRLFDFALVRRLTERPDLGGDALMRMFERATETGNNTAAHHAAMLLASDPRLSGPHLARLAQVENPSAELFEALARNPRFPPEHLGALLDVFPARIGELLCDSPSAPPAMIMRLIGSSSLEIRRKARQHPGLPPPFGALLDRLGFAPSMETSAAPPPDRPMSADDMEALYEGGAWFQMYLVRRPDLSPSLRERMYQANNPMLRQLLKRYPARQGTP